MEGNTAVSNNGLLFTVQLPVGVRMHVPAYVRTPARAHTRTRAHVGAPAHVYTHETLLAKF